MNRQSSASLLIGLTLIVVTLILYWPVKMHPFLELDDNIYVTKNYHVRSGITAESFKAAFRFTSSGEAVYYHPMTMLSHMLDVQLFGLQPAAHHLMNVIFHALNGLLLFLFLRKATGALYRSAMVSLLFVLHPLNVESVAWIAERKNLLSTTLWLLTSIAYVFYVRKPNIFRYLAVFGGMLLGLLAKPMLVTLPFTFLLLDFWPLNRVRFMGSDLWFKRGNGDKQSTKYRHASILLIEKIPLFILSAVWVYVASLSAEYAGQIIPTQTFSLTPRVQNAIFSYFAYVLKLFFPFNLSVFYPFPTQAYPSWQIICVLIFLLLVTLSVIRSIHLSPYLFTGWFWFLGTLVPVLGLKQQGLWPAMADRWTYLPAIGIFIALVWGFFQLSENNCLKRIIPIFSLPIIILMAVLTRVQLQYWQTDVALARHTLNVTTRNHVAHHLLGLALLDKNQRAEGIKHIYEAVKLGPNYNTPRITLGGILAETGEFGKAIEQLEIALRINPNVALAHNNLGVAFKKMGDLDKAMASFSKALQLDPYFTDAYNNLANTLKLKGRFQEAVQYYREALRINGEIPEIHNNIGNAYQALNRPDEALPHYQKAIRLSPSQPVFHINLAEALYRKGDIEGAISNYHTALRFIPDDMNTINRLNELQRFQQTSKQTQNDLK